MCSTLATPRAADDDPLSGVTVPVSTLPHPNAATPSRFDKLHAARIAALPLRNEKDHYEEAEAPLASTAELSNFIRDRGAAWSQPRQRPQRLRQRPPPQRKRRR
ncbi:hypothetical protein WS62_25665 [Burkholderia sp. ABCPW 14]|nr:hypothetical protein WS62_25665 [Burkholderia sp. ABCPW 14]